MLVLKRLPLANRSPFAVAVRSRPRPTPAASNRLATPSGLAGPPSVGTRYQSPVPSLVVLTPAKNKPLPSGCHTGPVINAFSSLTSFAAPPVTGKIQID